MRVAAISTHPPTLRGSELRLFNIITFLRSDSTAIERRSSCPVRLHAHRDGNSTNNLCVSFLHHCSQKETFGRDLAWSGDASPAKLASTGG